MMEDAVGVAVAENIGKGDKNEWGGYDDYLSELTRIIEKNDETAFNELLEAYDNIGSSGESGEIDQMKQTDINTFKAFISVTGGGLRRKATRSNDEEITPEEYLENCKRGKEFKRAEGVSEKDIEAHCLDAMEKYAERRGGGLRRKSTRRKSSRRKSMKRRIKKRKSTKRKSMKRKNTRRRRRR